MGRQLRSHLRPYEVIVVGAGPAGCSAATFLAKQGHDVLLVDRARFPRDKVCGDGISPPALEVLERMGALERIEDGKPWRVEGIAIASPGAGMLKAGFSGLRGLRHYGYVLSRRAFDWMLVQQIRTLPNVEVLEACLVRDLIHDGKNTCGIDVEVGRSALQLRGRMIVGADGAHSIVAKAVSFRRRHLRYSGFGVRAYFDQVDGLEAYIEAHLDKRISPACGWVFPLGERCANIGVAVPHRCTGAARMRALFDRFVSESPFMKGRLTGARRLTPLSGWRIPSAFPFARRSLENVLLVGDAAGFADTLTGEGIYYALKSGEYAAKAIHLGLKSDISKTAEAYERLWRRGFQPSEYLLGALIQRFVLSESFLNFNIRRARKHPRMIGILADVLCHRKSKMRLLL